MRARPVPAAVTAALDAAGPLPPRLFLDPEVFAFEAEAVFEAGWIAVGREADLPGPGDVRVVPHGPAGLLLVRGADLEIRAFRNVCPHRGARIVEADRDGDAGAEGLRCPYHGFRYGLDGRLLETSPVLRSAGSDRDRPGLVRERLAAWEGFLFVDPGGEAGPLEAHVEGAPEGVRRARLGALRRARRTAWTTRANWKLLVQNFQESLHFPAVHPGLERITPASDATTSKSGGAWLGGEMAIGKAFGTVSRSGRTGDRPLVSPPGSVFDAFSFPNLFLSVQPDYVLAYRLFPRAVDATDVVADVLVHPEAPTDDAAAADLYAFWDRVNAEDRAVCESQQLGIASPGFGGGYRTAVEEGVVAFDALVRAAYLRAASGTAVEA